MHRLHPRPGHRPSTATGWARAASQTGDTPRALAWSLGRAGALALTSALLLGACGKTENAANSGSPSAASSPAPTTGHGTPPQPTSGEAAGATGTAQPGEMKCDPFATATVGQYMVENNTWGSQGVVGWTQCISGTPHGQRGISAHWKWDWKQTGDNVKAYPEVIFGHKPGYPHSTTTLLPAKLNRIQTLVLDYDVHTEREGAGNMAIDMWLTHTANPTAFAAPPITHEVMIWLDVFGTMYAGGELVDKVRINGTLYRVYVGEKFGLGWRYAAFAPNSPMESKASIDLMPFFVYLKNRNLITTEEFLATVNFGNELISGSGETRLNRFAVTVN